MTPSTLIEVTRHITAIAGAGMDSDLRLLLLKTISADFALLSAKLFARTQPATYGQAHVLNAACRDASVGVLIGLHKVVECH